MTRRLLFGVECVCDPVYFVICFSLDYFFFFFDFAVKFLILLDFLCWRRGGDFCF